ncbi:MAG: hypothetical protein COW30_17930 [Rhodospirillales bacterium CG15_BIG_FIL_POST_REV_8_21_14_020_66_15]|nr:MAG: hypothetical protein COW30_17930 [Rhodospirillales bacterium CG15_BIG_FIL_POST_REV_8_21_14_020_66_15]
MPDLPDPPPGFPMKYIVFASARGEAPVLFPHEFTHSWVAGELKPLKPVSAGFVELTAAGAIRCFGHSSSLNLPSRGETDAALVSAHLKGKS